MANRSFKEDFFAGCVFDGYRELSGFEYFSYYAGKGAIVIAPLAPEMRSIRNLSRALRTLNYLTHVRE